MIEEAQTHGFGGGIEGAAGPAVEFTRRRVAAGVIVSHGERATVSPNHGSHYLPHREGDRVNRTGGDGFGSDQRVPLICDQDEQGLSPGGEECLLGHPRNGLGRRQRSSIDRRVGPARQLEGSRESRCLGWPQSRNVDQ